MPDSRGHRGMRLPSNGESRCGYCGLPWAPGPGEAVAHPYCQSCSAARRAQASARLGEGVALDPSGQVALPRRLRHGGVAAASPPSAASVLARLSIHGPPVDPFAVARGLGFAVKAGPTRCAVDGVVYIRATDNAIRQRGSVACGIGILLGHADPVPFALELLMPEPIVQRLYMMSGGNLPLLAQALGVSLPQIEARVAQIRGAQ